MMKLFKKLTVSFILYLQYMVFVLKELFRGGAKALQDAVGVKPLDGVEISKEKQVEELTSQELFQYHTGTIGYYQKYARDQYRQTSDPKWLKDIKDMEQYMIDMAVAYKKGNIKQWLYQQQQGTSIDYYPWHDEHGTTLIHKTKNIVKHIDKNGKEREYTIEEAETAGLPVREYLKRNNTK